MTFWDSFAKITAAEWLAIAGEFVAAAATIAAVWVSVATARRARKDAQIERRRADTAERALVEAQRESAQVLARTHKEIERDRASYAQRADAERKAVKQARLITLASEWTSEISGDLHAGIAAKVSNPTDWEIRDIEVSFERERGLDPKYHRGGKPAPEPVRIDVIYPHRAAAAGFAAYVWGHTHGDALSFTVDFTDVDGHRWRLHPDRSLTLLNPRMVRVAEDQVG